MVLKQLAGLLCLTTPLGFAPVPAEAKLTRLALVFGKGEAVAAICDAPDAADVHSLMLRREISPTPALPPKLTECRTSRTRAEAPPDVVAGLYTMQGARTLAKNVPGSSPAVRTDAARPMEQFELIVLSNPVAGRDAEYNRWYARIHVPDVLRNPGFVSAQRLKLVSQSNATGFRLPRYAVRFTFDSADVTATIAEVRRRLAAGITRAGPAFDMTSSVTRYYAVTGRKQGTE